MKYQMVQNRRENSHQNHIAFNLKGNGNMFFWVATVFFKKMCGGWMKKISHYIFSSKLYNNCWIVELQKNVMSYYTYNFYVPNINALMYFVRGSFFNHVDTIQLNQIRIEIILFRLNWHKTKPCLVPNQSEKCFSYPNLV